MKFLDLAKVYIRSGSGGGTCRCRPICMSQSRRPRETAAFGISGSWCAAGGALPDQPRATWKPAKDWLTGISSMRLMFRCGGSVATQKIVSAMSSAVIGRAPE